MQILRVTINDALNTFRINNRVKVGKPFLPGPRPGVIALIDYLNVEEIAYNYSYDLSAVLMTCETMTAVDWVALLLLSAAHWHSYEFNREEVSLFSLPGPSWSLLGELHPA